MTLHIRKILAAGLVAALPFGFSGVAEAATCDSRYALAVDNGAANMNDGCFLGTTNNDAPHPGTVNDQDAFGTVDWTYAGKRDGNTFVNGDVDISFSVIGTTLAGTWSVMSDLFDTYAELMIVTKGGAGNVRPDDYVGYLFTGTGTAATSGDYVTPFQAGNNNNPGAISHWSAYVRGTCIPTPANDFCGDGPPVSGVPVPAALPLLLTALGGVGVIARRRRKKAA